jgi:hypothetical protein
MPLVDPAIIPLCEVRLSDPGSGDPVVVDRGFRWPDILAHTFLETGVDFDAGGSPTLEFLAGAGLVHKAGMVLQDTRLSQYSTSGGGWEERRPATGAPRKYRLVQYDTTANVQWSATSHFSLPANPHVAFSFIFIDTPADHDAATYPPYVQVELGNGKWAIRFDKSQGSGLWAYVGGAWQMAAQLQDPAGFAGEDNDEKVVLLRCYRGRIFISTDYGRSYAAFSFPDGSAATIEASHFTLRGQGGMVVFGLQQIVYVEGVYTAPGQDTGVVRLTSPTITAKYAANGGSITLNDLGDGASRRAQYSVTLTPATTAGVPFTFYSGPEVYSVLLKYPVVRSMPTGAYTTPWEGRILGADVRKPLELDGADATLQIRRFDSDGQFEAALRWRKVEIRLGEYRSDGTASMQTVLTGYIPQPELDQEQAKTQDLTLHVDNASVRAKRTRWQRGTTEPMGGQTVNQFLDACIEYLGLDASYRAWHPLGNLITLPYGSPEDPGFWPHEDEPVWDKMAEITRRCGMELGVDNFGVYFTVLLNYVDPEVSATWQAIPTDELKWGVKGIRFGADFREAATHVLATGTDEWGNEIRSEGVDLLAELNTAFGAFCPWRETINIREDGTVSQGWLNLVVQSEMSQIRPKYEADIQARANLDTYRRQRGKVTGTTVGIQDSDEFMVMELSHTYRATLNECKTHAGLRRLG